jgi:hypothetical protein
MADIKLKSLLNEGYWSGGFKGSGRTWHPSKEDIAKAKERADNRDKWYKEKVKNPKTGNDITVKTALRLPKDNPARIAAVKMGKEKFKVGGFGYSDYFTRSGKPVKKKEPKEQPKQDTEKQKGILSKIASMFTGDYKKERE